MEVVSQTDLSLKLKSRGKVRDIYELGDDKLVMVATDRISTFDVVLPSLIPYKGLVLTGLSVFWFEETKNIIDNHLISANFEDFPEEIKRHQELKGRTVIVKKAEVVSAECVIRGYLSGSAWKSYKENKSICGIKLPTGLKESEKLPQPIFTPTTKAMTGHDIELTEKELLELVGKEIAQKLKEVSLKIYKEAAKRLEEKGIIIADTKFEFGISEGGLILIDELLTPDSSRFWPADDFQPGRSQKNFDKQFVRDYLIKVGWDKNPPAPELPKEIIRETSKKYIEAYEKITGKNLKSSFLRFDSQTAGHNRIYLKLF